MIICNLGLRDDHLTEIWICSSQNAKADSFSITETQLFVFKPPHLKCLSTRTCPPPPTTGSPLWLNNLPGSVSLLTHFRFLLVLLWHHLVLQHNHHVTFLGVITFLLLKAQLKYTEPSLLVV